MPEAFGVQYDTEKTGRVIIWRGSVPDGQPNSAEKIRVEVGALRTGDAAADYNKLRTEVWQVLELARIGRQDLLGYARSDRRKIYSRPVSKPEFSPPPPTQQQ